MKDLEELIKQRYKLAKELVKKKRKRARRLYKDIYGKYPEWKGWE